MRRSLVVVFLLVLLTLPEAAGAWSWPVDGPVLRPFSFDPAHPYAGDQHRGIDIGAPSGAPVAAPVGGVVSFAGSLPSNGLTLTIRTADGYSVTLVHLGSIGLRDGESVTEGAAVGTVGPTGTPEVGVPYVHLGVRLTDDPNGYVDPLALLPVRASMPPAPPPTLGGTEPVSASAPPAPATAAPPAADAPTGAPVHPVASPAADPAPAPAPEPAAVPAAQPAAAGAEPVSTATKPAEAPAPVSPAPAPTTEPGPTSASAA